jgi:hypothetical protein
MVALNYLFMKKEKIELEKSSVSYSGSKKVLKPKHIARNRFISFAILLLIGFGIGALVRPLKLIETKEVIKEVPVEVKVNNCACTPCVDEPPLDKCEFQSFAYEALITKQDIYGNYEIKKGDIYYFTSPIFYYGFDSFCTKNPIENQKDEGIFSSSCFNDTMILDTKLFKPTK